MSLLDDLRIENPALAKYSDEDLLNAAHKVMGGDLVDVADQLGYEAPKSSLGKEFYAGGNQYLAGMGHIGAAMGIPGAAEYTARKQSRAGALQNMSTAPHSWEEMKFGDPEKGILPYFGQLAAGSAPYMAEAAGWGLADVATGGALTPEILARYFGRAGMAAAPEFLGGQALKAGATFAERRAAVEAAREAGPGLARTAMLPVATYPSSLGDVLSNQQEEAGRYDLPTAMAAAVPYSALNILGMEGAVTHGALPRLGIKGLEKSFAGRAVSGALATGASEAVNEAGQEVMNQAGRMGVNPNATLLDPEALKRYKESAIGGALLGGVPGSLHAFHGRAPLDTAQPADLTKRLPDSALPLDQFGPQQPRFDQQEYEAALASQLGQTPAAAPAYAGPREAAPFSAEEYEAGLAPQQPGITEPFDLRAQLEGLGPPGPPIAPTVPAGSTKPKAVANAARDTTAMPVDPKLAQIMDTNVQLREHLPGDQTGKSALQKRHAVRLMVGDPQTVDEANATLKAKIADKLTGKKDKPGAEKLIQFYNAINGIPEDEQESADQWGDRLKAESEEAARAAAAAAPRVGPAGTEVPAKPTSPAELEAYKAAITPHLLAGVKPEELEALQMVHAAQTQPVTPEQVAALKEQAEAAKKAGKQVVEDENVPMSLRAASLQSGIPHNTLADRANRGLAKIEANAAQVDLPVEAAQALLGMQTSLDVHDIAAPSTAYEGTQRVNATDATSAADEFQHTAGYEPDLNVYSPEGDVEEAAAPTEGEEADAAVTQQQHGAGFENKWVDDQGRDIKHVDVEDAQEEYEAGRTDEPPWEQLTDPFKLMWVKGYLAADAQAWASFPKEKQKVERDVERQRRYGEKRTALRGELKELGTDEADTSAAGADAGAEREAAASADDTGTTGGAGQAVERVQGAVPAKAKEGVSPAAAESQKAAEPEKTGRDTGAAATTAAAPAAAKPAETVTKKAIHALADEKNIPWDDDPAFMAWSKQITGKERIDDMTAPERQKLYTALQQRKAEPKPKPGEKTLETHRIDTAREAAEKRWGELHALVPLLGEWKDLSPVAQKEFSSYEAKDQKVQDAVKVKEKDNKTKTGNLRSAIRATPGVDMTRMAKLLGPQLYGNLNDIGPVTIKELFQNSFDALKGAIALGQRKDGEISVDIDKGTRTITLTDNGTGMTPETINKAFLTLAGTMKETERASGGLGIAKMLFLFGNESLTLKTVRNGVESTLHTSGAQLMQSFSDPSKAPDIQTRKTSAPSGTTVSVVVPATFHNEETDAAEPIEFPTTYEAQKILASSPLFENVAVKLNGVEVPIGKNFPTDEYTVLTVAKFAWGKVRVLVAPTEYPEHENVTVLSNGLMQFKNRITEDPSDVWARSAPYKLFFNIEPDVKADAPNYPIALNRKGFSRSAVGDFDTLMKYLGVMYANTKAEGDAQSFGALSQFSEDGKNEEQIDLSVPEAQAGTTLKINKDDKVELRDGRMYVNNRAMPEMTREQLKAMRHDPTQFRVDQDLLNEDKLIVHDNVLLDGKPYLEQARAELGDEAVNGYLLGFARVFKNLRDAAAKIGGKQYEDINELPVGVSVDTDYYGVNTMIPFQAMMLNPTIFKTGTIDDVAKTAVGTMIHELAHHAERNHSETGFIPELQRMFVLMAQSGDMAKAIADLERVVQEHSQVYNYFTKEAKRGNLKNRGLRLEGGAERVGGQGAADRTATTSTAGGDGSDRASLRQATATGDQNRAAGQGREGPPAADGGKRSQQLKDRVKELHGQANDLIAEGGRLIKENARDDRGHELIQQGDALHKVANRLRGEIAPQQDVEEILSRDNLSDAKRATAARLQDEIDQTVNEQEGKIRSSERAQAGAEFPAKYYYDGKEITFDESVVDPVAHARWMAAVTKSGYAPDFSPETYYESKIAGLREAAKRADPASDWLDNYNNKIQFYKQALAEYKKVDLSKVSFVDNPVPPPARKGHTTAEHMRKKLKKLFFNDRRFDRRVTIVATATDLPWHKQAFVSAGYGEGASAFVVEGGHAYLIADRIPKGSELAVFLHEVGVHTGMERLIGKDNMGNLADQILDWNARADDSLEATIARRAIERFRYASEEADKGGVPLDYFDQIHEIIAYFVEEAVEAGVNPTALAHSQTELGRWFRKFWKAVVESLRRLGIDNPNALTAQDVVDLAYGAAHLDLRSVEERPGYAKKQDWHDFFVRRGEAVGEEGSPLDKMRFSVRAPTTEKAKATATKKLTNIHKFAQRHGLGVMITNDIADLAAANDFKEVRKYVDVNKEREASRVDFEGPVGKVAAMYNALPERERGTGEGSVNKFIHDATLRGDTKGIERLSASGQAMVKAVFKHGSDTLALKKKLIAEEVGREYDQRIAEETSDAAKEELRAERATLLSKFSKLMTVQNSDTYAPLKRFGDFVVSAKSKDYVDAEARNDKEWISKNESNPAHVNVQFADTQGEADALEQEIKRDVNFKGGKTYAAARKADIHNHRDLFRAFPVLQAKLAAAFPTEGVSPMARIIRDLYLQALAENVARKDEMRRRKIAGASTNMTRAFVTQGHADASFLSSLKHNDALQKAVQAMHDGADRDRRTLTPYLNEMLKRHDASYDQHTIRLVDRLKRAGSLWLLATNPSFYLQQIVQPASMSLPVIAGDHGWWRTARALKQGYNDVLPLVRGTGLTEHMDWSKAPADVRDMLHAISRNGAIDIANAMDQGEWKIADKGQMSVGWNRIDSKLRGLNTRVEAINRSVTAIAAYRLALTRNGGDKAAATDYAERMVRQTHGSYDGSNTPRYMQHPAMQVISQFRRFQIIQISLIARLGYNAFKGATATERAVARRALTYTLLHSAAIGGVLGMPGAIVLANLIARLFGPSDEPPDFEKEARELIGDQLISDLLLKGVPAMLGVDLSSKLGMGQMLSIAPFADFPTDRSSGEKYITAALGPVAGLGLKALDGMDQIYRGNVAKGSEQLMPSGIANAMKAYRVATEGVTMRSGDTIMSKDDINFADTLMQGLGMPTTTITHQQRLGQVKYEFDTYYKDQTTQLVREYQQARKDGASVADIMSDWRDLQDARVRNGYTRQPVSLLIKAAQQQKKYERATAGGVEFTKANRRFVQEQANL